MPGGPEDNYACRIIRSDRPCLVCPGKMDLVEAHPRYSLFSGLPLCPTETIDCLDCPKCGFSTTTSDYQYLQICKIQRHGMFQTHSRRDRRTSSGRISSDRMCSTCNTRLSSKWQFCPGCGSNCGSYSKISIAVPPAVVIGTSGETTSTSDATITAGSPSDASASSSRSSSDSHDTGVVRMVTPPPKRGAANLDTDMIDSSQLSP
jgi:hypothetical protein